MLKKALKFTISVLTVLAVVLSAGGVAFAVKPESAKLTVIDISKWNDKIDWSKVHSQIDGVIARIGYRGSVHRDTLAEDNLFYTHYKNAKSYSLPFGCYFYSLAVTVEQAKEEAQWVLDTLKRYNIKPDMPIYIDMEDYIVQNETTNRQRTDIAKAFCETLFKNGYYPGVYANKYWLSELLYPKEFKDCSVWVAQYASQCTYAGEYDMWQYTETGSINGITGNVDINHCYRNYPDFIKKYGFNGYDGSAEYEPDEVGGVDSSKFGMYKVTVTSLNVRSGPGTSFSSLGILKKDSEVYVHGYDNGWGYISFGNDNGWISLGTGYCTKTLNYNSNKKSIGFYTVNTDTLNVRSGSSTSYGVVDKFHKGDITYVVGISNGWGKLYYGEGLVGWISLDYADFTGTVNFMANGGKGGMNHQTILTDKKASLNKNIFTMTGKSFLGWSDTVGGAVKYKDGASVTMGSTNIVLYAVYGSNSSGNSYSWSNSVSVKNGTVFIADFKIKQTDFEKKYITLGSGTSLTFNNPFAGVVGTGSVVTVTNSGKSESFTVVIVGDVNGDSLCDGLDLSLAVESVSNVKKDLSTAQLTALDVNSDSKRDSNDIAEFKNRIFK